MSHPAIRELYAYLTVHDARAAIDFYQRAFGATELFRLVEPGRGRIGHAELQFGPRVLMVAEAWPEMGIQAQPVEGGGGVRLHLHVDDADTTIERAVQAGATLLMAPRDEFYGERGGRIRDPFGHEWLIGHEIEQVSPEEMQRRWDAMSA
jgi:PhnB protein